MDKRRIMGILSLGIILVGAMTLIPVQADTPTVYSYWGLEEGSGTISEDTGICDHDGILINAPTWTNDSIRGEYALDFEVDNSEYVYIGDSDNYSFTDNFGNDKPFSISVWFKQESSVKTQGIVGKYGPSGNREWLLYLTYYGHIDFFLSNPTGNAYIYVHSAVTLNESDWYHVVGTYNGNKTKEGLNLYINNSLESVRYSGGVYTGMSNTKESVYIGEYPDEDTFDGIIDDVIIFDIDLSSDDVDRLFTGEFPVSPTTSRIPLLTSGLNFVGILTGIILVILWRKSY